MPPFNGVHHCSGCVKAVEPLPGTGGIHRKEIIACGFQTQNTLWQVGERSFLKCPGGHDYLADLSTGVAQVKSPMGWGIRHPRGWVQQADAVNIGLRFRRPDVNGQCLPVGQIQQAFLAVELDEIRDEIRSFRIGGLAWRWRGKTVEVQYFNTDLTAVLVESKDSVTVAGNFQRLLVEAHLSHFQHGVVVLMNGIATEHQQVALPESHIVKRASKAAGVGQVVGEIKDALIVEYATFIREQVKLTGTGIIPVGGAVHIAPHCAIRIEWDFNNIGR